MVPTMNQHMDQELAIETFRQELADEILFLIARKNPQLSAQRLCQKFENKVGVKLTNFVEVEGHEFVCSSPVLSAPLSSFVNSPTSLLYSVNPSESKRRPLADDQYREMLLIQVCKLIHTNGLTVNACCENTGNSVLHFVVGIPGATTPNLVRLLLQAGGEELALKANEKGQNILHVIAGGMRAEENDNGDLVFGNEKIAWAAEDRKAILDVLSEELCSADLTLLVKAQDEIGDTPMHEWTLSASTSDFHSKEYEIEIASLLLDFGAQLRLPNNSGLVPLHYAFNTEVFEFLVQRCDVCRVRNDQDETPLMFMIKTIIEQMLSYICVNKYPEFTTPFLKEVSSKPINLRHLMYVLQLIEESEVKDTVRDTVCIPDIHGNSFFDIVLSSIKIASHDCPRFGIWEYICDILRKRLKISLAAEFRSKLFCLLQAIIPIRGIAEGKQDTQNPLHTLLNIRPITSDPKCKNTGVIECLDALLQEGIDVNAVDTYGRTPLDIVYIYQPPLFSTEIIRKLRNYGARRSTRSFKREIRSHCSKNHLKTATDLAKASGAEENVTVVGKYRYFNNAPIGSGAFSSVFLAIKDEQTDEQSGTIHCSVFALKRIEKTKVNPKEIIREVKTLMSLSNDNENIVRYYGVEHSQDNFFQYICLDLMDGDLNEFVTNDANKVLMNPVIRVQVTNEIIKGLAFLHGREFVHRDIKPGNILYSTNPRLQFKIADFGLTKNMSSIPTSVSCVAMAPGTRCWMAPEVMGMKSREHTQQSDIFSLGLVLHYLLTWGKHPFETGSEEPAHVIERRIVDTQIRLDRALHPEATSFLQQLLNQNPSKRPPAKFLHQHPFLWSERKKIEFLKAVGDQPEVVNPGKYPDMQKPLQATTTGRKLSTVPWNRHCPQLFEHMRMSNRKMGKRRKYRTTIMTDFLRFIRNAYSHKEERSLQDQRNLNDNIILRKCPSLVLDVFGVVQQLGYIQGRSSICQALEMN